MTLGTITQLTNTPSVELKTAQFDLKMARLVTRGLEQQVAQLRELLAIKTRVCEEQHRLIKLLESQGREG